MTNRLFNSVIIGLGIILVLSILILCTFAEEKKNYCGTIKYKIDSTVFTKHGGYTNPVMVVNFYELGIKEIHPNWNTYLSHQVGDRICFVLETKQASNWRTVGIIGLAGSLLLCILCCFGALASLS